jgi:hypothetical protein
METLKKSNTNDQRPTPPVAVAHHESMEICQEASTSSLRHEDESMAVEETTTIAPAPVKKKKKKKTSYKNMMATMLAGTDHKDIAKEREALSKGLGGGAFSKIDKI